MGEVPNQPTKTREIEVTLGHIPRLSGSEIQIYTFQCRIYLYHFIILFCVSTIELILYIVIFTQLCDDMRRLPTASHLVENATQIHCNKRFFSQKRFKCVH